MFKNWHDNWTLGLAGTAMVASEWWSWVRFDLSLVVRADFNIGDRWIGFKSTGTGKIGSAERLVDDMQFHVSIQFQHVCSCECKSWEFVRRRK